MFVLDSKARIFDVLHLADKPRVICKQILAKFNKEAVKTGWLNGQKALFRPAL